MTRDTATRETEPIRLYNLTYGIGQNCDLGLFMKIVTVFNGAYLDGKINDELLNDCRNIFNKKIEKQVAKSLNCKPVAFTLVEYSNGNLGLYGNVEETKGSDLKLSERGVSLEEEAEKWISSYGSDWKSREELKRRLRDQFGDNLNKDYNFMQKELMEFFLRNLHLLKK